uniref:DUF3849 domain-containing protein n=1 Tax=Meloidogyne hapla TaxID=6305 RepID=A0A1I8AYU3_MELHA
MAVDYPVIEYEILKSALNDIKNKQTIIYLIGLYETKKRKFSRDNSNLKRLYNKCENEEIKTLKEQIKNDDDEGKASFAMDELKKRGFVYHCIEDRHRNLSTDCTFYNGYLGMYYYPGREIELGTEQNVDEVIDPGNVPREITELIGEYKDSEDESEPEIQHYTVHEVEETENVTGEETGHDSENDSESTHQCFYDEQFNPNPNYGSSSSNQPPTGYGGGHYPYGNYDPFNPSYQPVPVYGHVPGYRHPQAPRQDMPGSSSSMPGSSSQQNREDYPQIDAWFKGQEQYQQDQQDPDLSDKSE